MAYSLTPEQQAVIAGNHNLVINAVAGSGKTTTLLEYARTRPAGSRILYLAFNASVKTEARQRFDAAGLTNVVVETAHSLAFKYIMHGSHMKLVAGYKSHELADMLGIQTGDRHVDFMLAGHVIKYMNYWCNSAVAKVQEADYTQVVHDPKALQFVNNYYERIVQYTREALAKMNAGQLSITHDFYLKKFQLQAPQLNYDFILFDEGQDASAAMLDVFLKQQATKIIVGDVHQQIYGWRYAVNSLQQVDFPVLPLSQSFRFNDEVALVANNILSWKHRHLQWPKPVKVIGFDVDTDIVLSQATLGRSNMALMSRAIDNWQNRTAEHIYFEGNINSYTFADEGASMYDILNLHQGKRQLIRDKLIASMPDMKSLQEYIEKTDDMSLKMLVDVVKKYGAELPKLITGLKDQHTATKAEADMIYSTVHRCKGMEYDSVQMLDDFMTEERLKMNIAENGGSMISEGNKGRLAEEVNLVYVAATRTKCKLILPTSLSPFKTVQVAAIQEHIAVTPPTPRYTARSYRSLEDELLLEDAMFENELRTREKKKTSRANSGKPWNKDDDTLLRDEYKGPASVKKLAKQFGRTESAIQHRLKMLGLTDPDADLYF